MARAEFLRRLSGVFQTPRGAIYFTDRNNNSNIATFNKDYQVIYAVPIEAQISADGTRSYAEKLNPILNVSVEELEKNSTNPTISMRF